MPKRLCSGAWISLLTALAPLTLLGCTADILGRDAPGGVAAGTAGTSGVSTDPMAQDPGVASQEPIHGATPLTCDRTGIQPGSAPLRRLTNAQYRGTLAALFSGIANVPDVALPDEVLVSGFSNAAAGQTSSLALLEGYHGAARELANQTIAGVGLATWAPCNTGDDPHGCGDRFVTGVGARLFRRPLELAEHDRLLAFFEAGRQKYGYDAAVRDTIEAMLLAPQFAFRLELGAAATPGAAVPLTSFEVATRLGYFLSDSGPDPELATAAEQGALGNREQVEAAARRLLAGAAAQHSVARFHEEWLRLNKLDELDKSATLFPSFDAATAQSMADATRRFVADAFWQHGSLGFLLSDTHAYVDERLAPLYGVAAPPSMTLVDVSAQPRAGLLTQVGLLAALAKSATDDPIHRGLFVMSYLLCAPPAGPPQDVPALEEPKAGDAPRTTRQHIELTHAAPACAGCHRQIDGIGFGFENYDALGQYRTEENGFPVDATGQFVGTQDIDGPFNGAVDMAAKLAGSKQTAQCVANQWFNYVFGKVASEADVCALKPIVDSMQASGGDMKELLISIAGSDAFRYIAPAGSAP